MTNLPVQKNGRMNPSVNNRETIFYFLVELRSRLIRCLILLFIFLAVLMYFANTLYTWLALPLLRFLPAGHLISTQIVAPFFVPFKLAFIASLLLALPFFLYELWAFIAPALYKREKKIIWPFLVISIVLFYLGLLFAYFIIFPMLFKFLINVAPVGVALSPDINEYLEFTSKLLFSFGLLFEIPMALVLLVSLNIIKRERFIKMRGMAIVFSFIIGMLLAPPDIFSQTLLAVPIWLLYELGIFLSRFLNKTNQTN